MGTKTIIALLLTSACTMGEEYIEPECPFYDENAPMSVEQFDALTNTTLCQSPADGPDNIDEIVDAALIAFPGHGVTADQITVYFSSKQLRFTLPTQPDRRSWNGLSFGYDIWVHKSSHEPLSNTALAHELAHTVLYEINGGFSAASQQHTVDKFFDEYVTEANELIASFE